MDLDTEAQAVRDVLDGDKNKYALLVDAYKAPLYNLAFRMTGSRTEAEDIVQDTFVKAYLALESFDAERRFFPWVYTIGLNLVRKRLKVAGRSLARFSPRVEGGKESLGPETALMEKEKAGQVQDALMMLKEDQREALVLRYIQGFSYEEMADILQVTASGAKMRVYRGVEQLRIKLPPALQREVDHEF